MTCSIQESFACTGCNKELLRIDLTAPVSFIALAITHAALTDAIRSQLQTCDDCLPADNEHR